jgi:hypothetical protein
LLYVCIFYCNDKNCKRKWSALAQQMHSPSPSLSLLLACFETDGINDGREAEFAAPGLMVPSALALSCVSALQSSGHPAGAGIGKSLKSLKSLKTTAKMPSHLTRDWRGVAAADSTLSHQRFCPKTREDPRATLPTIRCPHLHRRPSLHRYTRRTSPHTRALVCV